MPPAGPVVKPESLSAGASKVWDTVGTALRRLGDVDDRRRVLFFGKLQATLHWVATQKDNPDTFAYAERVERTHAVAIRPFYALFG